MNHKGILSEKKKLVSKACILYESLYMTFSKKKKKNKLRRRNQWLPGCGGHLGRGKKDYEGITQDRFWGVTGIVLYPNCGGDFVSLYMVKMHRPYTYPVKAHFTA